MTAGVLGLGLSGGDRVDTWQQIFKNACDVQLL